MESTVHTLSSDCALDTVLALIISRLRFTLLLGRCCPLSVLNTIGGNDNDDDGGDIDEPNRNCTLFSLSHTQTGALHLPLRHGVVRPIGQHHAVSAPDRPDGGFARPIQRTGPEHRRRGAVARHLLLRLLADEGISEQPAAIPRRLAHRPSAERLVRRLRRLHHHESDLVHQDAAAARLQFHGQDDGQRLHPTDIPAVRAARLLQGHIGQLRGD